jgi:hypothetical protein
MYMCAVQIGGMLRCSRSQLHDAVLLLDRVMATSSGLRPELYLPALCAALLVVAQQGAHTPPAHPLSLAPPVPCNPGPAAPTDTAAWGRTRGPPQPAASHSLPHCNSLPPPLQPPSSPASQQQQQLGSTEGSLEQEGQLSELALAMAAQVRCGLLVQCECCGERVTLS